VGVVVGGWLAGVFVINGLAFQVAPEARQTDLRRVSLHLIRITLRLLIGDVGGGSGIFSSRWPGRVDVHRVFRKRKNI